MLFFHSRFQINFNIKSFVLTSNMVEQLSPSTFPSLSFFFFLLSGSSFIFYMWRSVPHATSMYSKTKTLKMVSTYIFHMRLFLPTFLSAQEILAFLMTFVLSNLVLQTMPSCISISIIQCEKKTDAEVLLDHFQNLI